MTYSEVDVDRPQEHPSLAHIGDVVRDRLKRLDISSGQSYLGDVWALIAPVRERISAARDELGALVAKTAGAVDTAALRAINTRIVSVASDLFLATGSVPMVQELCTVAREAIAERVLELSRRELYFAGLYCEAPLALLAVGSAGRREELLFSDQDYLFVHGYGEIISIQFGDNYDSYYGRLGSIFMTKLEEVGISRCSGGIMPVNEDWRGSMQQWLERLNVMFRFERNDWEKNILNLIALMDTRFICGDRDLGLGFGRMVRSMVRDDSQALRHMGRVVSSMRVSKGFLRRFVVEAEGPRKGEFNLKLLAWMPLVMCIRLLAVNVGLEETSTLERIKRLHSEGHLTDKMATDLADAYHTITRQRVLLQIKKVKRIIDDDCYLNPYELPNNEREELKDAIGAVDELQHMVRSRFSLTASIDRILLPSL